MDGEELLIARQEIYLISFRRKKSFSFGSGITSFHYIIHYANIGNIGFVDGCMKSKDKLEKFKDVYLNKKTLRIEDIEEYSVENEIIRIKISEGTLKDYFKTVKKELTKTMVKESY